MYDPAFDDMFVNELRHRKCVYVLCSLGDPGVLRN